MTPDVPFPTNLLADLESRQDELLRLLTELEERTKQALASLTAQAKSPIAASSDFQPSVHNVVAASDDRRHGVEPGNPGTVTDPSTGAGEKPSRSHSRKAA